MFGTRRRRRAAHFDFLLPSLFLTLARFTYSSDVDVHTRDTIAAPISVSPAQNWEGIDGSWNTYTIQVGTPPQTVRVQISTASQQTWVVAPRGCQGVSISDCPNNRGYLFQSNESSTWKSEGRFFLHTEANLGYGGDADYGFDVVTLGGQGEGGPTLKNMTVGGLGAEDFWFGHFGINPKPTNFTSFNDPSPSYISTLKDNMMIPSVSFGYTAGAQYRFTGILSSLTLGGYDSSRFVPNDLTLNFASDNERDLVVAIQKIGTDTTTDSLLPNAVYAYVDSTVSQIWLPLEACQAFEKAFGLKYDNDTQLYLVNSDLHDSLTKSNPNVTFTLGQGLTGGTTVDVTLPYAAFDMQATPPYQGLIAQSYYFPLRRAANDTQYTLGRAFLQEAYLFVDWERETFNISQCAWTEGMTEHIVPVRSVNDTSGDSSGSPSGMTNVSSGNSGIGTGAIIGIAVGIGAVVALLGIGLFFCWRRRKRNAKRSHDQHEKLESPDLPNSTQVSNNITRERSRENLNAGNEGLVIPKAELDATQTSRGKEPIARNSMAKSGDPSSPTDGEGTLTSNGSRASMLHEADSKPREIFEMMGDMPIRQEAGGRALSEKETMMVREARYNGFNPTSTSPSTPTSPPPFPTPIATGAPGTPRADTSGHPSPMTPGNDAKDYLSVHPSAGTRIGPPPPPRRRQLVSPGEVIELSPFERDNVTQNLVSPISGPGGGSSDGHGTNVFSPLSPGGAGTGTMSSGDATVVGEGNSPVSERNRRRFSYE